MKQSENAVSSCLGQYREGVGIILLNREKKIFMGKRAAQSMLARDKVLEKIGSQAEVWQMPQGGIDHGEDILCAAMRELQEETGVQTVKVEAISKEWYFYDFPFALVPYLWGGKYVGQKLKWVLMQFVGNLEEINLSLHKEIEFDDWKWEDPESVLFRVVHFKREIYRKVLKEFRLI